MSRGEEGDHYVRPNFRRHSQNDSDIDGAQRFGISAYLVQTGKYDGDFV
ncbi:HAD hydrolase-like protein [Reichenbachiella faecimaris]